jgi:hypothetical protein
MLKPLLLTVLLTAPARAGRLDLDLYARADVPAGGRPDVPPLPRDLWRPGSPLSLRGESLGVQVFANAGQTALDAAGLSQSLGAFGHDRNATAATLGFGAVTLINLFRSWGLWREAKSGERSSVSISVQEHKR